MELDYDTLIALPKEVLAKIIIEAASETEKLIKEYEKYSLTMEKKVNDSSYR